MPFTPFPRCRPWKSSASLRRRCRVEVRHTRRRDRSARQFACRPVGGAMVAGRGVRDLHHRRRRPARGRAPASRRRPPRQLRCSAMRTRVTAAPRITRSCGRSATSSQPRTAWPCSAFNFRGIDGLGRHLRRRPRRGPRRASRDRSLAQRGAGPAHGRCCGWSFGANVALREALDDRPDRRPRPDRRCRCGRTTSPCPRSLTPPGLRVHASPPVLSSRARTTDTALPRTPRAFAAGFPDATVVMLEGTDHFLWRREKEAARRRRRPSCDESLGSAALSLVQRTGPSRLACPFVRGSTGGSPSRPPDPHERQEQEHAAEQTRPHEHAKHDEDDARWRARAAGSPTTAGLEASAPVHRREAPDHEQQHEERQRRIRATSRSSTLAPLAPAEVTCPPRTEHPDDTKTPSATIRNTRSATPSPALQRDVREHHDPLLRHLLHGEPQPLAPERRSPSTRRRASGRRGTR